MSLVTDLVEHYQQLVDSGELAPEDVPGPKAIREEWGCGGWAASETRKLLVESGVSEPLIILNQPLGSISDLDYAFRFLPMVLPRDENSCLLWDGVTSGSYGQFRLNKRMVQAHRVAWEYRHGPVPEGMELDHVFARGCRSKLCVNVAHLEPVTHTENLIRMARAQRWMAGIQVVTELDEG